VAEIRYILTRTPSGKIEYIPETDLGGGDGEGGMVYPTAGITVSNGSGWSAPITDNHLAWDAALQDSDPTVVKSLVSLKGISVYGAADQEGFKIPAKTVTDTYNILATDCLIICNKGTAMTVTLPATNLGQVFIIKNIGAGTVTLDGYGADTIDGDGNESLAQWDSLMLGCYEANKWVIL
jgi:hypothetical protein